MKKAKIGVVAWLLLAAPSSAMAHISLEQGEASAGAMYQAVLTVGHGCEGSPTVAIRVRIPDGVVAVVPEPKPGWQLDMKVEAYPAPVQMSDRMLTEGVREIIWSGGNLPDGQKERFVFSSRLPDGDPGTIVYFPVVQECVEGVHRWIDTQKGGGHGSHDDSPAPAVTLTPGS
jgi:periplasmic copper chaperone A